MCGEGTVSRVSSSDPHPSSTTTTYSAEGMDCCGELAASWEPVAGPAVLATRRNLL